MVEEWKIIEDSDGSFEISNLGGMRRKDYYFVDIAGKHQHRKFKVYLPTFNKSNGYYSYKYRSKLGKSSQEYVHRLVAMHYIPNSNENFNEVNHISGKKNENFYLNLEWCNRKLNMEHASRMGLINKDSEIRKRQTPINSQKGIHKLFKSIIEYDEKGNLVKVHDSYNKIINCNGKKSTIPCHRLSYCDHFFRSYDVFMDKYGKVLEYIDVAKINKLRTHKRKKYTSKNSEGNIEYYNQLSELPITREYLWFCFNHDICDTEGRTWNIMDR